MTSRTSDNKPGGGGRKMTSRTSENKPRGGGRKMTCHEEEEIDVQNL